MPFVITSDLGRGQLTWAFEHLSFEHLQMRKGGCALSDCLCHASLHLGNCCPWERSSETVTLLSKKGVKQGYICLPPSFPFPVTPVAAFLQHDRRELTHCSTGHDCLLFSNLGPQSKVHQLGALFAASCGMAARAAGGLQDLLPVTLQLHPRTSVCLVTFRRDCVSAHMRLRIHRHASVETCLLSCSSLPQNVASLVRAHLESALISPAGGPQALPVP